jgi:hypothetical protein
MEPKRDIRLGDVVLRRQPPVVGYWCSPPTAKKSHDPRCVYTNDACGPGSTRCPLCHFPFCNTHLGRHSRRFECPVDVWLVFDERRRQWYDRVKENPRSKPKVDVAFPEDADG